MDTAQDYCSHGLVVRHIGIAKQRDCLFCCLADSDYNHAKVYDLTSTFSFFLLSQHDRIQRNTMFHLSFPSNLDLTNPSIHGIPSCFHICNTCYLLTLTMLSCVSDFILKTIPHWKHSAVIFLT